jgi:hypothetical protein
MSRQPKKDAEAEELAMFFLRLATRNGLSLRVNSSPRNFVFKPVREEREQEDAWMNVEIGIASSNAVRLDGNCGAGQLHEILERMKVPHEYEKQGRTEELRLKMHQALRHLEGAFARMHEESEERWKNRMDGLKRTTKTSHSRS